MAATCGSSVRRASGCSGKLHRRLFSVKGLTSWWPCRARQPGRAGRIAFVQQAALPHAELGTGTWPTVYAHEPVPRVQGRQAQTQRLLEQMGALQQQQALVPIHGERTGRKEAAVQQMSGDLQERPNILMRRCG